MSDLSHEAIVIRIKEILGEVFEGENVVLWMNTPNPCFGNRTPQSVIDEGHADAVLVALENALDGLPY